MKPDKAFFRNLVLYGIIGGVSSGLDALIFALLVKGLGINQFIANTISIHCGIFLSFFLNSRYNFKKTDDFWGRFIPFYLTGLFGLALSQGILLLCKQFVFIDTMFSKLGYILIMPFHYLLPKNKILLSILSQKRSILLTKLGSIVIVALVQFFINRAVAFRDK